MWLHFPYSGPPQPSLPQPSLASILLDPGTGPCLHPVLLSTPECYPILSRPVPSRPVPSVLVSLRWQRLIVPQCLPAPWLSFRIDAQPGGLGETEHTHAAGPRARRGLYASLRCPRTEGLGDACGLGPTSGLRCWVGAPPHPPPHRPCLKVLRGSGSLSASPSLSW